MLSWNWLHGGSKEVKGLKITRRKQLITDHADMVLDNFVTMKVSVSFRHTISTRLKQNSNQKFGFTRFTLTWINDLCCRHTSKRLIGEGILHFTIFPIRNWGCQCKKVVKSNSVHTEKNGKTGFCLSLLAMTCSDLKVTLTHALNITSLQNFYRM